MTIITKLAQQAGYIPGTHTKEAFNAFNIDRFAELIINECSEVILKNGYWNSGVLREQRPLSPEEIANHLLPESIKFHFKK